MAGALNNVTASLSSFKINNTESYLHNVTGDYSRVSTLDGGDSFENTLLYTFNIKGLSGYTISYVRFGVLLLTADGDLNTAKNYTITASKNNQQIGNSITANLPASSTSETIIQLDFHPSSFEEETGDINLTLQTEPTAESCYFGLQYIIISLQGIDKELKITFTGPSKNRNANSITCGILVVTKGSVAVTFSKDGTNNFDTQNDNVEGRIYYRKDGIYIDNTLYGTARQATENIQGIVKLQDTFEIDPETQGIIAPTEGGIAASPQLVFNTLATAKNYTDEQIAGVNAVIGGIQATLDGIEAPSLMQYTKNDGTSDIIGAELTFSDDFEFNKETDKKLYIKWLEIS